MINQPPESGKVALVLGGGGARGYVHLGIGQILRDAGLEPDIVVGTSMGAVIGAAIANRANLDGMLKVVKRLDVNDILKISPESHRELEKVIGRSLVREMGMRRRGNKESNQTPVKLARLFTFFKLMTKNSTIEDLPINYSAIATDLENGEEYVIREGKVYKATAASSAIPGFIPPVKLKDRLLVDGGVVDVLPIIPAIEMGAEHVLAIDVSENLKQNPDQTPLSLFYRTLTIRKKELINTKISIARNRLGNRLKVLSPPVDKLNWLNFNEVEKATSIGREFIQDKLPAVKKLFRPEKS